MVHINEYFMTMNKRVIYDNTKDKLNGTYTY